MDTVYIATIEHKHGVNTYVSETYMLAFAEVVQYAREYWEDIEYDGKPATPDGLSDDEIVRMYFEGEVYGDEFYAIEGYPVIRAKVGESVA